MYIVAGLGNPGKNYEYTRHNVGFLAIDKLAEKFNVKVKKIKFKGLYEEVRINNEKVILLKPQTYMNNSGESIREVMNFYKVEPENVIILVDDIDITPYTLKIKKSGSAGTHNGLKSIIYQVQSDKFLRVKIGVGNNEHKIDLADYVLEGFSKADGSKIENAIERAADSVVEIIENGVDAAMNKFN